MKQLILIVAFGLTLLFFVPLPEQYLGIKIVVALMVISYGISLGAFGQRNKKMEHDAFNLPNKNQLKEVEKKLAETETREKV
ncbi:MAG: hypothetical protein A2Y25_03880 [Candidatus Melainabacteria bacterium GWF2_37_15]|nr:MAG: hypothetical protein A2Y25_03880 [Candidatus Melainabacteria bacterium GWF2_37_15]